MNLETLFEKFDYFADAPDAVEKLRELVWQLAVQGRLVNQSPDDESAAALAITISEDRAAFEKARSLARQRAFEPVADHDFPIKLPSGWLWTRLGNLCRVQAGFAFQSAAFVQGESGVPMIRIRDITKDRTQVNYVGEYRDEFLVDTGDYLVGMDGNFTVAKWRGPQALLNQRVSRLQWHSQRLEPSFFAIALQYRLSELQGTKAYTTVDHLSSGQIESAVVPLPPLAEQKRIVAKVDELMALCDRLEALQQERETRHAALARASLARFADAPTPANLNFIFHKSYDISPADLRKSILALAVQGKLVPQDPNDEPAGRLLAQIKSSKLRLQREGRIRKDKAVSPVEADSVPFFIPDSWCWAKLAEVTELITKGSSPKWQGIAYVTSSEGILFITSENVANYRLRKLEDLKYVEKRFNEIEPRSILKNGDILMNLVGASIGRTAVYDLHDGANINQAVALIRLVSETDGLSPRFLLHYLNSPFAVDYMLSSRVVNAQPNISLTDAREFVVPIPPPAEQRRIVAKVDELMALVDALETQLATARSTAEKLMEAVVAELTGDKAIMPRKASFEPEEILDALTGVG